MKFINLLVQVFIFVVAWFCACAITQWGGQMIGGSYGATFASLILLTLVVAVIFAYAGWTRIRQQKPK